MGAKLKAIAFYTFSILLIPIAFIFVAFSDSKTSEKEEFYGDNVKQWMTVKFSHKFHAENVGAECTDCHGNALTSENSSDFLLPKMATCYNCHDEKSTPCEYCHLDTQNMVPYEAPIRRIIFSHKFHIENQKIECLQCHAGSDKVDYATPEHLPSMESCFTCHNNRTATNECEACHKETVSLLPSSHKVVDFMTEHKKLVRAGGVENNCITCHTDDFCQQCHDGVNLVRVPLTGKDFYSPYTPQSSGKRQLVLQRVHDLNYRYTHGIEAKSKEKDCYVCHDRQTFCSGCHAPNGDITSSQVKPEWHSGNDFVTIGVGSGGGRHAKLAKRDIEMCMSCHDTEGADPTCIICHVDRNPGLGNDPKTHQKGFMKDVEGDWHTNDGSVCFSCHVNTRKAGLGFCGYCHGEKD